MYFSFKYLGVASSARRVLETTCRSKRDKTRLPAAIRLRLNINRNMIALKRLGKKYDALHHAGLSAERNEDITQLEGPEIFTATVNNVSEETRLLTGSKIHNEYS